MATVTAEAVRSLAHTPGDDAALALMDGDVEVIHAGDATDVSQIVYTRAALMRDYGDDISDEDAEALAAQLTTDLEERLEAN
jgi:hypothetical protein